MVKEYSEPPNGLIISAAGSHCGKTTVTAMLLAAFKQRLLSTQPYKIGADFFDTGMHCVYSGEISLNLDSWIMGTHNILRIVNQLPAGYRGLVEGWGGIFEHHYPDSETPSTMEIAQLINWPIILIISCHQDNEVTLENIQAYIQQAGRYLEQPRIAGVIFNKVEDLDHITLLKQRLKEHQIKTLGIILEQDTLDHPIELHNAKTECRQNCPSPKQLAAMAETYLDIDAILQLCQPVANIQSPTPENTPEQVRYPKKRIAISQDEAFFFYYRDNSDFLRQHRVEILPFSPLHDKHLPNHLDGLILSGGIPENYAQQLTQNKSLRNDILTQVKQGLDCYAECGGLMFLSQGIYLRDGQFYPMIGAIPGIVELTDTLQNFGYAECFPQIGSKNLIIRGHEYHYSRWLEEKQSANLWQVKTCHSHMARTEGYQNDNIHASFVHLYFPTAAQLISHFFKLTDSK